MSATFIFFLGGGGRKAVIFARKVLEGGGKTHKTVKFKTIIYAFSF